ncbi:MAG: RHS repeat-associated core domain-containing protein, partial [Verrucomicrobiota bacterium]
IEFSGADWARDGEKVEFTDKGELSRHESTVAGIDVVKTQTLAGNTITTETRADGQLLASSTSTWDAGFAKVTHVAGGVETQVEYDVANDAVMPLAVKSIANHLGKTTFQYAKTTGDGLTVTETFDPPGSEPNTVKTVALNSFGQLLSLNVKQGGVTVATATATGHGGNVYQRPASVTWQSGGVSRTHNLEYHADGSLKKWNHGDGRVDDFEWDLLGRLQTGSKFDGRAFSPTYTGSGVDFSLGSETVNLGGNAYGELQSFTSNAGAGFSLTRNGNEFTAAIPDEGNRGFAWATSPDGVPTSTTAGMGTPGGQTVYSVETVNGTPCIAVENTVVSGGSATGVKTKTFTDGYGRVRRVSTPHPMGNGMVDTDCAYDIPSRRITITPPAPSKPITIQYNEGWNVAVVTQGSSSIETGAATVGATVKQWIKNAGREVSSVEISLADGKTTSRSNGKKPVAVTPLADGHSFTIAGPRGFAAEVTGSRYGVTGISGNAGGKTFGATVTRNGEGVIGQVAVNPPGPLGTFTTDFSAAGRPVSLSGPGVNLNMAYDFSGGGVKVTGTDASSGKDFLTENDAEGIARRREATGKDAYVWDGNPLGGTSGMTAAGFTDQKVETTYGPALLPLERTRSDGSGVSYMWNADGSLASFTEFDGGDNGGAARAFAITRDADGRENGITSTGLTVARTWNLDGTLAAVSHQTKDADGNTVNYQVTYPSYFDDKPLVETFGGSLTGYEIRRNYDAETGEAVRVELRKNGQPVHAVDYGRDAVGRFSTVVASGGTAFQAEYTYPSDLEEKLTWAGGNTSRTLAGDGTGTLGSIATTTDAGENYSANYSFTGTRRTGAEISIHGMGIANWNYGFTNPATGTRSLQSAALDDTPRFSYAQNAAGNRVSGAANIANQYAIAAQPGARFYTVEGSVKPGATVKISRTGGPTVDVPTAADGSFAARLPVPEDGTNPVKIPLTVTGTLPGAGDDGTDAIADDKRTIVLTPAEMQLTYGAHGSLASDWRWTYHWDIEGRLAGMNTNHAARNAGMPNLTLRFSYDDLGRRIGKSAVYRKRVGTALVVTRTVTSSYVYDNWKLIAEEINDSTASGPLTRYYTWGKDIAGSLDATGGVGGLLAIHQNGATYVPVYDGGGNIIALVDSETGEQLAAWQRGPFGEPLEKRGNTSLCAFGFATHFTDEETGLVYFGHRYYSPTTGRWLSREPLGETESFNLFDYCHGDPVNKVDVVGLFEYAWYEGGSARTLTENFVGYWLDRGANVAISVPQTGLMVTGWAHSALGGGGINDDSIAALEALKNPYGRQGYYSMSSPADQTAMALSDIVTGFAFGGPKVVPAKGAVISPAPIAVETVVQVGAKTSALERVLFPSHAGRPGFAPGHIINPLGEGAQSKILSNSTEEIFEIAEGVRRSKAAEMLQKDSILARISRSGQPDEIREIPLRALRSPKEFIEAGNIMDAERFASVLEGARNGGLPPIDVRLGTRGVPIKDVFIRYFNSSK